MIEKSTHRTGCETEAGRWVPQIDRNRCEGKRECVAVCPYDVFRVETLSPDLRTGLSLRGRLKGWVHNWQQALTPNADACRACGLCVKACPEQAIRLVAAPERG